MTLNKPTLAEVSWSCRDCPWSGTGMLDTIHHLRTDGYRHRVANPARSIQMEIPWAIGPYAQAELNPVCALCLRALLTHIGTTRMNGRPVHSECVMAVWLTGRNPEIREVS